MKYFFKIITKIITILKIINNSYTVFSYFIKFFSKTRIEYFFKIITKIIKIF